MVWRRPDASGLVELRFNPFELRARSLVQHAFRGASRLVLLGIITVCQLDDNTPKTGGRKERCRISALLLDREYSGRLRESLLVPLVSRRLSMLAGIVGDHTGVAQCIWQCREDDNQGFFADMKRGKSVERAGPKPPPPARTAPAMPALRECVSRTPPPQNPKWFP